MTEAAEEGGEPGPGASCLSVRFSVPAGPLGMDAGGEFAGPVEGPAALGRRVETRLGDQRPGPSAAAPVGEDKTGGGEGVEYAGQAVTAVPGGQLQRVGEAAGGVGSGGGVEVLPEPSGGVPEGAPEWVTEERKGACDVMGGFPPVSAFLGDAQGVAGRLAGSAGAPRCGHREQAGLDESSQAGGGDAVGQVELELKVAASDRAISSAVTVVEPVDDDEGCRLEIRVAPAGDGLTRGRDRLLLLVGSLGTVRPGACGDRGPVAPARGPVPRRGLLITLAKLGEGRAALVPPERGAGGAYAVAPQDPRGGGGGGGAVLGAGVGEDGPLLGGERYTASPGAGSLGDERFRGAVVEGEGGLHWGSAPSLSALCGAGRRCGGRVTGQSRADGGEDVGDGDRGAGVDIDQAGAIDARFEACAAG